MSRQKDLKSRVLINGISALFLVLLIIFGGHSVFRWFFVSAVALISTVVLIEYNYILTKKGFTPAFVISAAASLLYIFAVFLKTLNSGYLSDVFWHTLPQIIVALFFFACFIYFTFAGREPIANISSTFFGFIYIALPLGLIVRIMYFFLSPEGEDIYHQGSWWIFYILAVTKSSDMGGYFVGGMLGRHKLANRLSPNKTWEGAIGGFIASMVVSLLICYVGKQWGSVFIGFTYLQALWLGLLIGLLGQLGDLAESLLKRDAGVKDSGVFPGVGGLLDMTDSLLFTTPVVYIFLRVIYIL